MRQESHAFQLYLLYPKIFFYEDEVLITWRLTNFITLSLEASGLVQIVQSELEVEASLQKSNSRLRFLEVQDNRSPQKYVRWVQHRSKVSCTMFGGRWKACTPLFVLFEPAK